MKYNEYWVSFGGFHLIVAEDEDVENAVEEYLDDNDMEEVAMTTGGDGMDWTHEKELTKEEVKNSGMVDCSSKVQQDVWGKVL